MRHLWIFACVILSGCATYQPAPIDPARLAQRFDERTLSDGALHRYLERQLGHAVQPWPPTRWSREMLTFVADYYSPALALARAQWASARAAATAAGARPNPVLQFPFEYTTNHEGAGQPYTTGPTFDITVETAHKRDYRIDQSGYLAEAARLNLVNAAWKVRSQVRDALLGVFSGKEHMAIMTRKVDLQQQIVDMLRRRASVGEAAAPDVDRAEFLHGQAQAERSVAQRALLDAQARLASALGMPSKALDAIRIDFDEFRRIGAAPPPAAARRTAIFHRADLLGALAEYAASQSALQLEIARQYPDIHIGLGYTYDVGANKVGLGLAGVTLPLFDRNRSAIAQAEAKRSETAARVAALQDGMINDLEHALAGYRADGDALQLSASHLATAERQLDSQTAHFAAGAADRLALTQAQADYQAGAIDYLNRLTALQQAAGALDDAMQQALPAGGAPVYMPQQGTSK
jgi:cobalt-zinc-cadmium efflux system outer membrane protein